MNEPESVVVVGVDGSEHARVALRWAAREAQLRGAILKVVHAWHFPVAGFGVFGNLLSQTLRSQA
jgi:nucleotide-binding universal stress UspA family protein